MNALIPVPENQTIHFVALVGSSPERSFQWKRQLANAPVSGVKVYTLHDMLNWLNEPDTGRPAAILTDALDYVTALRRTGPCPILAVVPEDAPQAAIHARDLGATDAIVAGSTTEEFGLRLTRMMRKAAGKKHPIVRPGSQFAKELTDVLAAPTADVPVVSVELTSDAGTQMVLAELPQSDIGQAVINRIYPTLTDDAIIGQISPRKLAIALPTATKAVAQQIATAIEAEINQTGLRLPDLSDCPQLMAKAMVTVAGHKPQPLKPHPRVAQTLRANVPLKGLDPSALSVVRRRAQQLGTVA